MYEPNQKQETKSPATESRTESFFDHYFDFTAETESPIIYHRWCAVSLLGAILGRKYYIHLGHETIYPNFYTMLIGSPGTRKSTAIKIARNLLKDSGYKTFAGNKTSKEKFLQDLASGFSVDGVGDGILGQEITAYEEADETEPREVYVAVDEVNDFIGANNHEFISLLTTLWDNLPSYAHRIKTGRSVRITKPTVNIISGNTPTGFALAFPPEIMGQGMLSRLLLIYGESNGKRIPFPEAPNEILRNQLIRRIVEIGARVEGPCQILPKTKALLGEIYKKWAEIDDARFKTYSTRRFTHLLKLCLVVSASRGSTELSEEDVIYANSILSFAEQGMPAALGEFGRSKHAAVGGKILQILEDAGKPVKMQQIWKLVHSDLNRIEELGEIIRNLLQAEKIQMAVDKLGYLPRKQVRQVLTGTLDFKLLRESQL